MSDSPESAASDQATSVNARSRRRIGVVVALVAATALLAPLVWFWQQSLLLDEYSVSSMGYPDYGGGPVPAGGMAGMADDGSGAAETDGQVSVTSLVGPDRPAKESITLTAREETIELGGEGNRAVSGITLNHQSPGPQITMSTGEQLQVRLVNESVPDGITLHWHGADIPNGQDGVAGVTQDAVEMGEDYVYRFAVEEPGTYWYHSHQVSDVQVSKGLFGSLVVLPSADEAKRSTAESVPGASADTVAVVHSYSGNRTVNGTVGAYHFDAAPGTKVRVRVVNTNDGPLRTWVTGSSYQVLAVDARDLHEPSLVEDKTLVIAAGGRADLLVTAPAEGTAAAVNFGGGTLLALGPPGAEVATADDPQDDLDLLSYGTPAPLRFDPAEADRSFEYRIGRRLGFLDGRPGFWWTINGHLYPDLPMFVVEEGDVVRMTISNDSGQVHPMHLHGHHAVVLSRNGIAASGSPWWVDSLDVGDGESYVIAFVADNPGIWMDHCHNLTHASQGLVTHLVYAGVTTPFVIGGDHHNDPE